MQQVRGKRVTVAGLGRFGGGIAVARWLAEQGAEVLVTDRDPAEKLADSVKQLDGVPVNFRLGEHREEDFAKADLVVASPAIPISSPFLAAARNAGVPVTTEIRLFVERCPATILGVTGTKGKSTTTAMLGAILRTYYRTWVGGNIGKSLLADLDEMTKTDLVVLELSSFMLEHLAAAKWSPHVALVTMISADHLEWHGSLDAYVSAKQNIVRFQRPDDFAVLNGENATASDFARMTKAKVSYYTLKSNPPLELLVPGIHNQLNAQGALATAQVLGLKWEDAQRALKDFPGLPHRLQLVHESNGVRWYNDSIATIPEAAAAALEAFPAKKVIQIVGGYDKGLPIAAMCGALVERAKAILCIGATADKIINAIGQPGISTAAGVYRCGDLTTAVTMARQVAGPGDVVLLSPGAASYDQFTNFEQRGEMFTKLARGESA